jgi:hydrogenase maturation factor
MGKLSAKDLKKLLSCIKKDKRVIVPPTPGYDSGVHLMGDKYLVISTDPCLGVPKEWFGWLMIHYPSSDVAVFGAKPEFCSINLLGPPSKETQIFQDIMRQACETADELDLAIVTGHTGTYDGISTLIGVCTVCGTVDKDRLITPGGAKPGDHILCTKPIGLEIAINFALTRRTLANKLFGPQRTKHLLSLVKMQSCIKEALALAEIESVHAMHDTTEGGLIAALNEMAEASNVGFKIQFDHIPLTEEARIFQEVFDLSDDTVLAMSSTGTILASVIPETREVVEQAIRNSGLNSSFLGSFTKAKQRILVKDGEETLFPMDANDPYIRILSGSIARTNTVS